MLRNYLILAIRNLIKNKVLSMINILGLGASMSICMLVILFVSYQQSSDAWHEKADRIYRITCDYRSPAHPGSVKSYATTPMSLAPLLQEAYPGVELATRVRIFRGIAGPRGEQADVSGLYAEPSLFEIFDFKLAEGDAATSLSKPSSVVLSRHQAVAYFGDSNPLGETVMIGNTPYTVTGVLADQPGPSYLRFRILVSFVTLTSSKTRASHWPEGMNDTYTFAVLREGSHASDLEAFLAKIIRDQYPSETNARLEKAHVQLLTDASLGVMMVNQLSWLVPGSVVYFVSILAILTLAGACYNYANLTVAMAIARAQEVAIRKVLGAYRAQITCQILIESLLTAFLGMALAMFLLSWLIPSFNELYFTSIFPSARIRIGVLNHGPVYLKILGFSLGVGLLAGVYPALRFSRFVPAQVLKGGSLAISGAWSFKRALVMGQYGLSLFFVLSTLFVYVQFRYLVTSDYGFDHENILNVRLPDVRYGVFRQAMEQSPAVESISGASQLLMQGEQSPVLVQLGGGNAHEIYQVKVDRGFVTNLKLKLLAGRNFEHTSEIQTGALLNGTAARRLGVRVGEQGIGRILTVGKSTELTVVGILDDFQTSGMGMDFEPIILRWDPAGIHWANVRVIPGRMSQAVEDLERIWSNLGSSRKVEHAPFTTQIREGMLGGIYSDALHIITLIATIAVLLALLGVLGVAIHTTKTQVKEIAIRRVLGASPWQVAVRLSKSYLIMLALATLLSAPAAWFANHLWLNQFPVRITMNTWLFGSTVAAMIATILAVVWSQTLRAATSNPVRSLSIQ